MTDYNRGFTAKTKRGRQAILERLVLFAAENALRMECENIGPRAVYVCLSKGPYKVSMDFDARENLGCYLGHWYIGDPWNAVYPQNFGEIIGGTMNTVHYGKATTQELLFADFLASLKRGFDALSTTEAT